jgi:hypothetical protein
LIMVCFLETQRLNVNAPTASGRERETRHGESQRVCRNTRPTAADRPPATAAFHMKGVAP